MRRQVIPARSQRGVALIVVLWVSVLLAMLAGSYALNGRSESRATMVAAERGQLRAWADAGIHRAAYELYKPYGLPDRWEPDGSSHELDLGEAKVRVTVRDESARIDLNQASDALLRRLFEAAGLTEEEALERVDAIADWRDPDKLKRLHGAEEQDYEAAGRKDKPGNRPFRSVEELKSVLGVDADLYDKVADKLTVYNRQLGINASVASRELLLLLPGVTETAVDEFIAMRDKARENHQPMPVFVQGGFLANASQTQTYAVQSEVEHQGVRWQRNLVLRLTQNKKNPILILAVREGNPAPQAEGKSKP